MNEPTQKDHLHHEIVHGTAKVRILVNDILKELKKIHVAADCYCVQQPETTEDKIRMVATMLGVNPAWALAVAEVESKMGKYQKSPTRALGVFQMTSIAMKDLLWAMEQRDDDMIDICCGILFLRLLLRRHKTEAEATRHYCDPNDRDFYVPKVLTLMEGFERDGK